MGRLPEERRVGRLREERRTVTALFADLVGSTVVGERLDPEEAKLVIGDAVAIMVRAVEQLGGTVKDLAGDGLLALFGAPVSHEDDPERAIRAGLRIVDDVGAYGREVARAWGLAEFAARVGINTGPVVVGAVGAGGRVEYGATGDAVNVAARLQAASEPGTVIVGASTWHAAEPLFEWSPPREVLVKGKLEPVTAFAVTSVARQPGRVRGLGAEPTPLVGREAELQAARRLLEGVLAGRGGVLAISGEAGIGKSRLIAEMRRAFAAASADADPGVPTPLWLEARAISHGGSLPYWSIKELIRDWLGVSVDDSPLRASVALRARLRSLPGEDADALHPQLAALLELATEEAPMPPASGTPEAVQRATFAAVARLFRALGRDRPLVLALDDLHWADPSSIQLLEHLLPLTDEVALLLVLSQRTDRRHAAWLLAERAARDLPHRTTLLELAPLDVEPMTRLLHTVVGEHVLPESVERQIVATSDGNPFFIEELIRSLIDRRALEDEDGRWRLGTAASVEMPESIAQLLLSRIDQLDETERDVLDAASVLGRQFSRPLLEAVLGAELTPDAVASSLTNLQRLEMVDEVRRWPEAEYQFRHALIAQAAYDTLLHARARELHLRAARALETTSADGGASLHGVLARHWEAAGRPDEALKYHRLAAETARRLYAVEEATQHLSAAIALAERAEVGVELLAELHLDRGVVASRAGRIGPAREDLETGLRLARSTSARPIEMVALRELGSLLAGAADYRAAIPLLESALEIADALSDGSASVDLLSRLAIAHANRMRLDVALELAERASREAEALGDESSTASAADALVLVSALLGDLPRLEERAAELVETRRAQGDPWYLHLALMQSAVPPLGWGRWDEAEARLNEALGIARKIGDRGNEPAHLATLAWVERGRGKYGGALAYARQAVSIAEQVDHPEWIAWASVFLGWVLEELRELEEARHRLAAGIKQSRRAGAVHHLFCCLAHQAWTAWLAGDRAVAEQAAEEASAVADGIAAPWGMVYLQGGHAYLALARVYTGLDQLERARQLTLPIRDAADRVGWVEFAAASRIVLGGTDARAGRAAAARSQFDEGLALAAPARLPSLRWEAHLALAGLTDRDGSPLGAERERALAMRAVREIGDTIGDPEAAQRFTERADQEVEAGLPPAL